MPEMLKEVTEMKEEKKGYSRRSFLKKGAWIGTIATMIPAVVGNAAAIQLPTSPPAESGRDDPNIVPTTLSPCPFCGSRRVEMSRTKKKTSCCVETVVEERAKLQMIQKPREGDYSAS